MYAAAAAAVAVVAAAVAVVAAAVSAAGREGMPRLCTLAVATLCLQEDLKLPLKRPQKLAWKLAQKLEHKQDWQLPPTCAAHNATLHTRGVCHVKCAVPLAGSRHDSGSVACYMLHI